MISRIVDCGLWMADGGPLISAESVGWIMGGLILSLLASGALVIKKVSDLQRVVVTTQQPLDVDVRKSYVSREECLACKNDMRGDVRDMKALYEKAVTLITTRDERLSEKLESLGDQLHTRINGVLDDASERRRRIHDKIEEHGKAIASIETRTDVSKAIGHLGKAIIANFKNS